MIFKRELTPSETSLLGDNPEQRLHVIIDVAFKRMMNLKDTQSVQSRITSLMSTTPMKASEIRDVHNSVYGNSTITMAYTRFVIHGMHNAGSLKRTGRGVYVKGDM